MLTHRHLIIRSEIKFPPDDPDFIKVWVSHVIQAIGMQLADLGDDQPNPIAYYCTTEYNRGLTCTAILETSSITLHSWDECNPGILQLDVYSCSDFTPVTILHFLEEFEPIKVEFKFIDRDKGLVILSEGLV